MAAAGFGCDKIQISRLHPDFKEALIEHTEGDAHGARTQTPTNRWEYVRYSEPGDDWFCV